MHKSMLCATTLIMELTFSRFSKLFMSHLDMEFQAQSAPSLKTLVSTQVRVEPTLSFVTNNFYSFKVSKYTGLFAAIAAINRNVRMASLSLKLVSKYSFSS